jgi:hypothetical protein
VSDAPAAPPAAPAPEEGGLARLVGVFVSPVKTFASIARRPTWLLPFAIGIALTIPLTELIFSKSDMRAEITKSMSKSGRKVSEEQLDQMVERTRRMGPVFDAIALVFVAAAAFGTAAVLWGACQAFGWNVRYKQSLGVTTHAFLPQTVASAGLLAVLWNRDTVDKATMGDALHTNLGFLADAHADPVGHALLSSADVVSFWIIALLVLGLSAAAGASRKRVAILVVSLWALFVLGKAGLAAVFQ